jgi:hypothetical protein
MDRDPVRELRLQRLRLLLLAREAGALQDLDAHAALGSGAQGLIKRATGASPYLVELRRRETLLVVASGIRQK